MFSVHTYEVLPILYCSVILLLNKIYSIFPCVVRVANIELFFGILITMSEGKGGSSGHFWQTKPPK